MLRSQRRLCFAKDLLHFHCCVNQRQSNAQHVALRRDKTLFRFHNNNGCSLRASIFLLLCEHNVNGTFCMQCNLTFVSLCQGQCLGGSLQSEVCRFYLKVVIVTVNASMRYKDT